MNTVRSLMTAFTLLLVTGCATVERTGPQQAAVADITGERDSLPPVAEHAVTAPAAGHPTRATTRDDFWDEVRSGFRLPDTQRKPVTRKLSEYARHSAQVERILQRGTPYLAYIQGEVSKRGFPGEIVLLPFVESGYDPFAYSHGRAAGLWQFTPGTGRHFGLKQDWWYDGRRDVVASTGAALDYLDRLQQEFDGDWLLALAAYNAGGGTVRRAIRRNREAGKPTDFWHLKLPRETTAYVPKLLAISRVVREPEKYGVQLAAIDPEPPFVIMDTGGQLDIGIAAELAEMDTEALYQLNPGFNRWATHPDGPHRLVIPVASSDTFRDNLADLPDADRARWVRHKINPGETLSHIATRYDTTVAVLRNANHLRGSGIRAGDHLLVPVAARDASRYAALQQRLQSAPASASKRTYRVQNGDSLWGIARSHQVTVKQLTRWNRLDSGALIRPGQQLVIWKNDTDRTAGKRVRKVNYTVRSGDSLYRISRKFSVSIADLREWNNLPKGKYLQPGQNLKLYVDVTRQSQRG